MIRKSHIFIFIIYLFISFTGFFAFAQNSPESDKSWFLSFIEQQLSAPNRQIHISNIDGVLSSKATIGEITVSDNQGVWLKIANAKMDWNRLALLRGEVSINELSAENIEVLRKPLPASNIPSAEASGFAIPQLPVAVNVEKLDAQNIVFGQEMFGLAAHIKMNGNFHLDDGDLNTNLDIARLDAQGQFTILANFSTNNKNAQINIKASEPKNGIVATLLNIENRPAIDLNIAGNGRLDDLLITIAMQADAVPFLNGTITLHDDAVGKNITANIAGPIAVLMAPQYRDFFGQNTALDLKALMPKQGGVLLDRLNLQGDSIDFKASGEVLADGFLRRLKIDGIIQNKNGQNSILPIKGGQTKASKIALNIDYGNDLALNGDNPLLNNQWRGNFTIENFTNPQFSAKNIIYSMGGVAENLDDPKNRHVAINVEGKIQNISSDNQKIAASLGQTISMALQSTFKANAAYRIDNFKIEANGLVFLLKGFVENLNFNGDIALNAQNLQSLASLSNTKIEGKADIAAKGTIGLFNGAFDLELNGKTQTLKTGNALIDRLLAKNVTLSGGISRDETGFSTQNFQLGNDTIKIFSNGEFSNSSANMDMNFALSDLALLDKRLKGPITINAAARGHNKLIALSLGANIKNGAISGKKLQNSRFYINAILDNTSPYKSYLSAMLNGAGLFDGKKLQLSGNLHNNDEGYALNDLLIALGDNLIQGNLAQNSQNLIDGSLHIDAKDIETLAAFFLTNGRGSMTGDFTFSHENGQQQADIISTIKNLSFAGNQIDYLDINATIKDPLKQLQLNGTINAKTIKIGEFIVNNLTANAKNQNGQTVLNGVGEIQTNKHNTIRAEFAGSLDNQNLLNGQDIQISLDKFIVQDKHNTVSLLSPTRLSFYTAASNFSLAIDNLQLKANEGFLNLKGTISDIIDVHVDMKNFPLKIVDIIKPDLALQGALTGTADIKGSLNNPDIVFDIHGEKLSFAALKQYQITPLTFNAKGQTHKEVLDLQAEVIGGGLEANLAGTINLATLGLDMDVQLKNFPINLANGFIPEQNLNGVLSGNAHIYGTIDNPSANFSINGQDLSAKILKDNGLAPLNLKTTGLFDTTKLDLSNMTITGPEGLNIEANGHIPFKDNGLDFTVLGSAPMQIANQILAERGAQISGDATMNLSLKGSLKNPEVNGNFNLNNGQFIDPTTNIRLGDIVIGLNLNGDTISFTDVKAKSSYGGDMSISGSLSTNFAEGMPLDLTIILNHTRYSDGKMVTATVNGQLNVTGAMLTNPLIAGNILIENADISLLDSFGGASLMDIRHKNLTVDIATTLKRAGVLTDEEKAQKSNQESAFSPEVQIRIHAPNKVFVRGMGLDAELGGNMGIMGKLSDIRPVGGLELIRGRFEMLSQRLDFSEGSVTLVGNLNPEIHFVANNTSGDITVTVTVSGTADSPKITFSSTPELPQDEVLARLIFKRSVGELSPLQIASLASAVAEFSGITNESIFTSLRNATGLDDLDIITDDKGNTGVRAGSYIKDNVYLGVEAGSSGETKASINLDISKNLKTKGSVTTEGNSSLGLFFEKDY